MGKKGLKNGGIRYCKQCKTKLQNNGYNTTKKGRKQRWHCPSCGVSRQQFRPDLRRRYSLASFVKYLIGTQAIAELKVASTTWRKQTYWCWDIDPIPQMTGEVYDYLVIDLSTLQSKPVP